MLRPVLPASPYHSGVLHAGDLGTEQGPARGPRTLTQKNKSGGDGFDRAGDVCAVLYTHKLSTPSALPAV